MARALFYILPGHCANCGFILKEWLILRNTVVFVNCLPLFFSLLHNFHLKEKLKKKFNFFLHTLAVDIIYLQNDEFLPFNVTNERETRTAVFLQKKKKELI